MGSRHPIRHYYDRNTRRFLAFGGGAASGAIHRQLWGPGVSTVHEAADCINQFLKLEIERLNPEAAPTMLDLGCGVGGTVVRLARAFPGASLHGVTISEQQVALARAASVSAGVEPRCTFYLGDFESMDLGLQADLIFAVESFTHSRSAKAFFSTVARHLRPGGHVIIVDDFLLADESTLGERGRRLAREFRAGWQVPSLSTVDACVHAAQASGIDMADERDFTSLIRLRRPRDRAIATLAPLVARLGLTGMPFFGNLVGGNALHQGLCDRIFGYRWLRFRYSR
jgi:cyclopropane fatty-acyl-phospholipid synthase-like methyltransferase